MRNEYIGTSIDGDARAACQARNTACGSCGTRQPRYSAAEGQRTVPCGRCGQANCTCQSRNTNCNNCENECHQPQVCSRCGQANCTCQSRNTGCNNCENEYNQANTCNRCGQANCTCRQHNHCNGQTPAMVYAAYHDLDSIYCAEKALLRGTLFGCLDKPMCNERCGENPCATRCQADKFAIWELRLYLNTHPCDQQALALMRKLLAQMDEDCGCMYTPDCGNRWSWADGPWPWEYQHCCGKEA